MKDERGTKGRGGPTARWYVVVPLLFVTFAAMLGAIYWVVQSARH